MVLIFRPMPLPRRTGRTCAWRRIHGNFGQWLGHIHRIGDRDRVRAMFFAYLRAFTAFRFGPRVLTAEVLLRFKVEEL